MRRRTSNLSRDVPAGIGGPRRSLKRFLSAALSLFSLACPSPSRAFEAVAIPPEAAAALSERTPRSVDQLREIERQTQRVLPQILACTVAVQANRSAGSGVLIGKGGLVLTAAHVIGRPGRSVSVTLTDGRRLIGHSLGADHSQDAGLVKLDEPSENLPFLPVKWDRALRPGEWVITTGQPGGIVDERAPPVRLGRVYFVEHDVICTDCTLVGGDSGGPLCNLRGEVVGIHSSIGPRTMNNFHVPLTAFRPVWDRLLAGELWGENREASDESDARPFLGIAGETKNGGCVVTQVFDEGPAAKAGILPGDRIAAINDSKLSSMEALISRIAEMQPGDAIRLSIERGGETKELPVQLEAIGEPLPGSPP